MCRENEVLFARQNATWVNWLETSFYSHHHVSTPEVNRRRGQKHISGGSGTSRQGENFNEFVQYRRSWAQQIPSFMPSEPVT